MTDQLRRARSGLMVGLMIVAVIAALVPLLFILIDLVRRGIGNLGISTAMIIPALTGTLIMVATATAIGVPLGVAAGVYCAEFPRSRLAGTTRFAADVLNGIPSIVVGVFVWGWIVARQGHFSALAGSIALALLMLPLVMRTTEEMLALVPGSLREAALALGYPHWRATTGIVLRAGVPGIATGSLLAVARIAGETAPLLFTALGSHYLSLDLNQPMAALPLLIFSYATGPYDEWHRTAWAAALVLIFVVFALSLAGRCIVGRHARIRDE
ncbi:MAG TPA: phosphate ABC transporter permease PstA [Gemmatimonadales bacterium]|nr:phosphate ABC transporter permease PstA [Gemmatimonadales bacterium]